MISRRLFLGGMLAGTAAPAIVRASSLMPLWVPKPKPWVDPWAEWLRTCSAPYENALHRMLGENGQGPLRIGVDHGRPGGDMSAWVRGTLHDGVIHFETINVRDTWR